MPHFRNSNTHNSVIYERKHKVWVFIFLVRTQGTIWYQYYKKVYFLSVNTKYISSRELKTSKFSLVLRTRENSDVFNPLDEIYLVFTDKK